LNEALLVSIHDWMDAGLRELYIYDQVHMNGPPEMGRHFWGHLPLSWMAGPGACEERNNDDDLGLIQHLEAA
jgi:hypothetical protein